MERSYILDEYKSLRKKRVIYGGILLLSLLVLIWIAFTIGGSNIGYKDLFSYLGGGLPKEEMERLAQIFFNIRLPRIVGALLTGGALAVSGMVMQTILRNPLASPYTLGISSSAAFGAALAIVIFGAESSVAKAGDVFYFNNPYVIAIFSFLSSLIGLALILLLSKISKNSLTTIVLAGIIIGSFFSAGIAALQFIADKIQLSTLVFWTFGDLGRSTWVRLAIISAVCIPSFIYFYLNRWNYKALKSGDEYAISLGVNPQRVRLISLIVCTLCTSVVVSFFGVIAFIGLVVPLMILTIVGNSQDELIIFNIVGGGAFLLLCDTLGRVVFSPITVPVGIITSFVGIPIFLFFLVKRGDWRN